MVVFRRSRRGEPWLLRTKLAFLLFVIGALIVLVTRWLEELKKETKQADPAAVGLKIQGVATVIDGDTIKIDGRRIRLYGVDAPEMVQRCQNAKGQRFACGKVVAEKLAKKIGVQSVDCHQNAIDRYQRIVATCRLPDGEILNGWLVESGYAMAYRQYGGEDYVDRETSAKARRVGLWAGSFEAPWRWRKRRK